MTTAHGIQSAAWLLVAIPAISAVILLCAGKLADKWGAYLGALVPVALFVYAVMLFFSVKGQSNREIDLHLFSWVPVGGFRVSAGMLIDPLAMVFVLLITGVGSLIHIYAVGYMSHDPGKRRFFGYFNLFIAAMLLLVLSDNYLSLYVGWEGVGVASYLLISFYYDRPSAATAGNKAFFANRVGDVGLSLAIMLMFTYVGSTAFSDVFDASSSMSNGVATAISLMLVLGACGKSGQFPLQTWLPDAMEGPTPVSALIHAATMVTAGVYLIARSAPLFDHSQAARTVVTIIGAITLLYGCICAFGQDDLKRVLAYSTVSQIGYMFLARRARPGRLRDRHHPPARPRLLQGRAVPLGRFGHARDERPHQHAALRRADQGHADHVRASSLCGYLAIIGIPPFTGFFTKDKIIEAAFDKGGASGWILGLCALLGAGPDRVLHDARAGDDVLRQAALGGRRAPARGAGVDDGCRCSCSPRSSLVGGYLLIFGGGVQHWLTPSVGPSVEVGAHTISPVVLSIITIVVVLLAVAGARRRVPPGARVPAGRQRGHGRLAPQPVRGRVQRGRADASGPVALARAGLPRQPRGRRRGQRPRRVRSAAARRGSNASRPASCEVMRCRCWPARSPSWPSCSR